MTIKIIYSSISEQISYLYDLEALLLGSLHFEFDVNLNSIGFTIIVACTETFAMFCFACVYSPLVFNPAC